MRDAIRSDAEFFINTAGVLGEQYLEIVPGKDWEQPPIAAGTIIHDAPRPRSAAHRPRRRAALRGARRRVVACCATIATRSRTCWRTARARSPRSTSCSSRTATQLGELIAERRGAREGSEDHAREGQRRARRWPADRDAASRAPTRRSSAAQSDDDDADAAGARRCMTDATRVTGIITEQRIDARSTAADKAATAAGQAGGLIDNVNGMVTDLRAGKGTAGALLVARRAVQRPARADPRPQAESVEVLLEGVRRRVSLLAQDERARRAGSARSRCARARGGDRVRRVRRSIASSRARTIRIRVYFHHDRRAARGRAARRRGPSDRPRRVDRAVAARRAAARSAATRASVGHGRDRRREAAARRARRRRLRRVARRARRSATSRSGRRRDGRRRRSLADGDELLGRDPPTLDRVLAADLGQPDHRAASSRDEVRPEARSRCGRELARARRRRWTTSPPSAGGAAVCSAEARRAASTEARALARGRRSAATPGSTRLARDRRAGARDDRAGARRCSTRSARERGRARGERRRARAAALGARAPAVERGRGSRSIACARAIDKIDPLLAKVAELSGRIARGEGSLGRADARSRVPRGRQGARQDPEAPAVEDHRAARRSDVEKPGVSIGRSTGR